MVRKDGGEVWFHDVALIGRNTSNGSRILQGIMIAELVAVTDNEVPRALLVILHEG